MRRQRRPLSGRSNRRQEHSSSARSAACSARLSSARPRSARSVSTRRSASARGKKSRPSSARSSQHPSATSRQMHPVKALETADLSMLRKVQRELQGRYEGKKSLMSVFRSWDDNHDGVVDESELGTILSKCGVLVTKNQVAGLFKMFDDDSSGTLAYDEFCAAVFSDTPRAGGGESKGPSGQESNLAYLRARLESLGGSFTGPSQHALPTQPMSEVLPALKHKYQAKGSLAAEFRKIDENHDGYVSKSELQRILVKQGFRVAEAELDSLFSRFDTQIDDDRVQYAEFIETVFPPEDHGYVNTSAREGVRIGMRSAGDSVRSSRSRALERGSGACVEEEEDISAVCSPVTFEPGENKNPDPRKLGVSDVLRAARLRDAAQNKLRRAFAGAVSAFRAFDANGDGRISHEEFRKALVDLRLGLSVEETDTLLQYVDRNGDGFVEYDEFCRQIAGRKVGPREMESVLNIHKHAAVANVGMVRSESGSSIHLKSKTRMHRYMFPTKAERARRQALERSLQRRSLGVEVRAAKKGEGAAAATTRVGKFRLSELQQGIEVPSRRARTPIHTTTHLIAPPVSREESARRFAPESLQYGSGPNLAYRMQDDQMRRRRRHEARIAKKRIHNASIESTVKDMSLEKENADRRRIRTLIRTRLQYYEQLQVRFEKDRKKAENLMF